MEYLGEQSFLCDFSNSKDNVFPCLVPIALTFCLNIFMERKKAVKDRLEQQSQMKANEKEKM